MLLLFAVVVLVIVSTAPSGIFESNNYGMHAQPAKEMENLVIKVAAQI